MKQDLAVDLAQADLSRLVDVTRQIVGRPGVSVAVPTELVSRIESAIQTTVNETLLLVREQERSQSSELLKLRFR